jgi:protein phosphatase PTC2/3
MSTDNGKMAFNLSRDHRPSDIREQERILSKGGRIYRTEMVRPGIESDPRDKIVGPLRIFPGKLSVSRTIGDIEAKQTSLGGVQGVVSS